MAAAVNNDSGARSSAALALGEPASTPAAIEFHRGHVPLGELDALVARDAPPSIAPSRALTAHSWLGLFVAVRG